jgi:hypothetical protein
VYRKIIIHHYHPIHSVNIYTYFQVVGISRLSGGGGNSKAKWWGYRGQLVGGIIKVKWWGEIIKVKWWGYQGQLMGEIIKVKWWGYLGQVVGISRPSGGDIKVRGRGLEVKVKKKWWGVRALSNSLYSRLPNETTPVPLRPLQSE